MADIRSYTREKGQREEKGYREKLTKHKWKIRLNILLLLLAIAVLGAMIVVQYRNHVYTSYDVVDSVERTKVSGSVNKRLGDAALTYSKDGAHCTGLDGKVKWNQTYGIQDVKLAFCGDTVAIGEYNGRNVYVANSEEILGQITTNMPIRDLAVAKNGRITAVLVDTDVMWVNTYSSKGELLYKGQAHMNDSGYPTAISLSPDGELLAVAYMYVDAGVLKTNVAFYNFGPVGDNYSDHLAGVFICSDVVIPYMQFLNDSTAFAVGDDRLLIYSGDQKPTCIGTYMLDREVCSVYYDERYIGLVFLADNTENRYMLEVYDTQIYDKKGFDLNFGKNEEEELNARVIKYYFDMEYTDIFFEKNNFVIYNEKECQIITLDGVEKFSGSFSETVELMLPAQNAYEYNLVTDDSIVTIQLK